VSAANDIPAVPAELACMGPVACLFDSGRKYESLNGFRRPENEM
jgi:hypothetical protein